MVYSIIVTRYGQFIHAVFFPKTSKDNVSHLIQHMFKKYPSRAGYTVDWNG